MRLKTFTSFFLNLKGFFNAKVHFFNLLTHVEIQENHSSRRVQKSARFQQKKKKK